MAFSTGGSERLFFTRRRLRSAAMAQRGARPAQEPASSSSRITFTYCSSATEARPDIYSTPENRTRWVPPVEKFPEKFLKAQYFLFTCFRTRSLSLVMTAFFKTLRSLIWKRCTELAENDHQKSQICFHSIMALSGSAEFFGG